MKITKVTPVGEQGPRMQVRLEMGPTDPPLRDPELQSELNNIEAKIRQEDPGVQSQGGLQKAADGASWLTGQFAVIFSAVGPTLGVVLVAWLNGRAGRKVKIKIGETEAEGRTPEEVERLLALAAAYKKDQERH